MREGAAERISTAAIPAMGSITFLTGGPSEVHAWLVRRGAKAPEAAGRIHTDFEKGFIRAEQMFLADLLKAGSEAKVREQGKMALRGKDYVVEDGDVLHILAST